MKISYECGPCFLRQAREALDLSTDDETLKMEIMGDIFEYLSQTFKEGTNSNSTGSTMHEIIKQKTGCRDPYHQEKIESNRLALKYLEDVKKILDDDDSLENHVKIAIIGNILDFGAFTLDDDIESVIKTRKMVPVNLFTCCFDIFHSLAFSSRFDVTMDVILYHANLFVV